MQIALFWLSECESEAGDATCRSAFGFLLLGGSCRASYQGAAKSCWPFSKNQRINPLPGLVTEALWWSFRFYISKFPLNFVQYYSFLKFRAAEAWSVFGVLTFGKLSTARFPCDYYNLLRSLLLQISRYSSAEDFNTADTPLNPRSLLMKRKCCLRKKRFHIRVCN